ncbi:MAG: LON peptidase substrate-binding domain-containing protein [Acidobacteriota bacterium]
MVPVFPLPGVVFFPSAVLPLHIFEPRYRQMVRDSLDGERVIAMALLKPGWEANYGGRPEVFPVGCLGKIEAVEKLADGRFNLALAGLCRVEFTEFLDELPYRMARIRRLPEPTAEPRDRGLRDHELELLAAFSSYHAAISNQGEPPSVAVNPGIPFAVLVNSLCLHAEVPAVEKQRLLEIANVEERCVALTRLLTRLLDDAIGKGDVDRGAPSGVSIN